MTIDFPTYVFVNFSPYFDIDPLEMRKGIISAISQNKKVIVSGDSGKVSDKVLREVFGDLPAEFGMERLEQSIDTGKTVLGARIWMEITRAAEKRNKDWELPKEKRKLQSVDEFFDELDAAQANEVEIENLKWKKIIRDDVLNTLQEWVPWNNFRVEFPRLRISASAKFGEWNSKTKGVVEFGFGNQLLSSLFATESDDGFFAVTIIVAETKEGFIESLIQRFEEVFTQAEIVVRDYELFRKGAV